MAGPHCLRAGRPYLRQPCKADHSDQPGFEIRGRPASRIDSYVAYRRTMLHGAGWGFALEGRGGP